MDIGAADYLVENAGEDHDGANALSSDMLPGIQVLVCSTTDLEPR